MTRLDDTKCFEKSTRVENILNMIRMCGICDYERNSKIKTNYTIVDHCVESVSW
jgi:hypothetical protein